MPVGTFFSGDLVKIADTIDELLYKLYLLKINLEAKGLRVNVEKTKIMICSKNLHSLKGSGNHPCGVCRKEGGSNSVFCDGCNLGYTRNAVVLKVD